MVDVRSQPTLGDFLLREGIITQSQLNQALEEQQNTLKSIGRILVDKGFITESVRMAILQKRFGFELIRLKDLKIEHDVLTRIPHSFAEKHRVVPVRQEEDHTLIVAMEDPSDILVVDAIKNQLGMLIKPVVGSHEDIQACLEQYASMEAVSKAQAPRQRGEPTGLWYKLLKNGAFPVLALAPLVGFFVALYLDVRGWEGKLQAMFTEGVITTFDLIIYIALVWGLWTIVLFEINGLIFNPKEREDEA